MRRPDPNAIGREEALAQALRNLLTFTVERFTYTQGCDCDCCQHVEYAEKALKSEGHGNRGLTNPGETRPLWGSYATAKWDAAHPPENPAPGTTTR